MFNIERLFIIELPHDILSISKEKTAYALFYSGMILAFFGTLNPWFLWPIAKVYTIISSFLVLSAMAISATMQKSIFSKNEFLLPILSYTILIYYQSLINHQNVTSLIFNLFHISIFLALFRFNIEKIEVLATVLAKTMAIILSVSIPFFLLYLVGFPLPSTNGGFNDMYSYSNYFFFLIDDRSMFSFIPRFHSVFLEPGQMGTATTLLLLTQIGKWKKWYNIILFAATVMSFSLAAYILLFAVIFLSLWIQGQDFFKKLIITIAIISTVVVSSFYYNQGYNLIHDLIIIRMEVEDGQMAGDNRVNDSFKADYENFLESSDIILGKDLERVWGSAGYKVFFYDYGLMGIILLFTFYYISVMDSVNRRRQIAALLVALMNFYARDFPLWYSFYLPIYCTAMIDTMPTKQENNNLGTI